MQDLSIAKREGGAAVVLMSGRWAGPGGTQHRLFSLCLSQQGGALREP